MDNPYQSPKQEAAGGEKLLPLPPRPATPSWAVGQVRIVALLMFAQGFFEACFGLGLAGMTFLTGLSLLDPRFRAGPNGFQDEESIWKLIGIYVAVTIPTLAAAGLHLVAGYRNYFYRGHTLGLIALGSSIVHVFTLCCFPTGLALAIYGLIVYLNQDAMNAFELAESGHPVEAIHATYL